MKFSGVTEQNLEEFSIYLLNLFTVLLLLKLAVGQSYYSAIESDVQLLVFKICSHSSHCNMQVEFYPFKFNLLFLFHFTIHLFKILIKILCHCLLLFYSK